MDRIDDMQYKVLQLIPSGVGVYDVTGTTVRKVYLNDGYYQMISANKDKRHQYDGTSTVNAVHSEDISGLIEEAKASIAEKRMLEYSFRVLTGDGGFRWIAIRANHIPVENGTERFFAAYYDIDELVRTRDKLRENDIIINDALIYSDIIHFIFYPDTRRCEMVAIPEKYKDIPNVLEDFPEVCIREFDMDKENAQVLRQAVNDILAGCQETECIVSMNMQRRHFWYRIHLQTFRDHKGNALRVIGNAQNVDSFKAAERNFNEEKLRMQSLESGILATSCFNVTRDQNIDVNNSETFNYSRTCDRGIHEEAIKVNPEIGRQDPATLSILLSGAEEIPDKRQRRKFIETCSHIGLIKNYEAGNREIVLEYRRRTGRGLIWVSTRIVMLPDPETNDVLAFFYTRDINDQKIRQEVASSLVTHNYINASYVDLETGLAYQPIESTDHAEMNPEGENFDAFYQSLIKETVYPEDQERCLRECRIRNIVASLEQNGSYNFSYRENCAGTDDKPYRLTLASAFYLNDEKRYIVISRSDITEQYEYEQQQKQILREAAERAEKANMAKTDFLSRMSHDIRTPLNGIIGMAALAGEEEDTARVRDYLDKIGESGKFLLGLVNDILDMNRVESGKIRLHPEAYSFVEFRNYLDSVIRPLCNNSDIEFTCETSGFEYMVMVDKLRFNQIFFNLLSNAVKFTPKGGHVALRSRTMKIDDSTVNIRFSVEDDGIGMKKEFQTHMFDPFEQEYTSSDSFRTGSGLGLAIVKSMVDLMGGTISVDSKLGRGSTFTVDLNFEIVKKPPVKQSEDPEFELLKGKRILVAEDNAINGEIIVNLLEKKGIIPYLVTDGYKAVQAFMASGEYYYDGIIMDVRMPVMDGLKATRAIRAMDREDAGTVPVAALTANAFDEDVEACMEAGMNMHIAKPIEPDQLYGRLCKLLK